MENFKYRDWDLTKFEDIHLIPTNHSTLRKLKTPQKIFSNQTSKDIIISKSLINIFEKFGAVFVDNEFDNSEISNGIKIDNNDNQYHYYQEISNGGFLSTTNSQNFLLEDIIKITRLNSHNYWKIFVLPYIKELRDFNDLDKVIDKLFDRLPTLLANDENLRIYLEIFLLYQQVQLRRYKIQQIPYDTKLVKPTELLILKKNL
ncbi:unnamed protein product [Rhizophagus irregularis]|nr:unnamed protein product [Rhizophagus irregularis]